MTTIKTGFVHFPIDFWYSEKSVEETVMKKYEYNISAASVHTFDKIQEEVYLYIFPFF